MRAGLSFVRGSIPGDYVHFLCLGLPPEPRSLPRICFCASSSLSIRNAKIKPRRADNPTRLRLVLLSRWFNWRDALTVVRPTTLLGWQRKGLRLFWRRRSAAGRPPITVELQRLIRRIAGENPSWGEERIANELLLKLGLRVAPRTIRKYLPKLPAPLPGGPRGAQRWATFLKNHAQGIIACDFCVAVTATFRVLYVLVVMERIHPPLCINTLDAKGSVAANLARDKVFLKAVHQTDYEIS
jgi:putative transposase